MPTVPRRQTTELQTAPIPGRSQGSTPSLAAFGGGPAVNKAFDASRELADTGIDIETVNLKRKALAEDEYQKFQDEQKKNADEVMVRDIDLGLSQEETRIALAVKNMQGRDAAGASDYAALEWEKADQNAKNQATNPEQIEEIEKRSVQRYANLNRIAQVHTDEALRKHDDEMSAQYLKALDEQSALSYQDPEVLGRNRTIKKFAIEQYARRAGLDKAWVDEEVKRQNSASHVAVMSRMLTDGRQDLADKYDKQFSREIQDKDLPILDKVRRQTAEDKKDAEDNQERVLMLGTWPDEKRPQGIPKVGLDEIESLYARGQIKTPLYEKLRGKILNINDDPSIPVAEKTKVLNDVVQKFVSLGGQTTPTGTPKGAIQVDRGFFKGDITNEQIKDFRDAVIKNTRYLPADLQQSMLLVTEKALIESQPEKKGMMSSFIQSIANMNVSSATLTQAMTAALPIFNRKTSSTDAFKKLADIKERAAVATNPNVTRYQEGQMLTKGTTVQYNGRPVILPNNFVVRSVDKETGDIVFEPAK
jgi:hypothetical protein